MEALSREEELVMMAKMALNEGDEVDAVMGTGKKGVDILDFDDSSDEGIIFSGIDYLISRSAPEHPQKDD